MQILKNIIDWFNPKHNPRQVVLVSYAEADKMLLANKGWHLAPEEDDNNNYGRVYLERYL